ncbi:DUF4012 domain-containing protein [Collinsella intestinalis]|uniref:DUF4012 domain-containing protein n=1 Tax=Collinsella intestinalis TaxID=147207 RepID=UPI0026711D1A|nr:DUF4012 domain-containing protein [Collinsella intestinalis]
MPVDNNTPRGNHFASSSPRPSGVPSNPGSAHGAPAPDTTEAFMMAHNRGAAAPRAARPITANAAAMRPQPARTASVAAPQRAYTQEHPSMGNGGTRGPLNHSPYEPQKKKGKIIAIVVSLILLGIIAFGATTGFFLYKDAKNLKAQAGTLISEVKSMKDYLKEGEGEQLNATAGTVADQITSMRDTVNGPAWTIASFVPVYGNDIKLVRGIMEQVDVLAQNAMLPACEQLEDFKLGNMLSDGAVNLPMLKELISTIQDVEPVVSSSIDAIDALPEPHIGNIRELMGKLLEPMDSAKTVLSNINEIAPLLPRMLGDGGTRTYLLMAQQNAELRSTGGLAGSVGPLIVENGKISVGEFIPGNTDLGGTANIFGEVTSEEDALFTNRMANRITDTNFNPDFPRAAHFAKGLYEAGTGQTVDGVIAIDPVFLQYLLALAGGVDVNGINVNGENAGALMLHDAYNMLSVEQTDQFFSDAAGLAFKQIMGNLSEVGFSDLFKTLGRGIAEHRFLAWMENPEEEELMTLMGCSGALKDDPTEPELGVYFADETWSKISWYFSSNTHVDEGVKNSDGTMSYHVTTTMTNNLTLAEAAKQASYITGYHPNKKNPAGMFMHVYLVAPAGGSISNISTEGGDFSPQPFTEMPYNQWTFFTASPVLAGGETITISYDVTVSAEAEQPLMVRTTPTAQVVAGWGANEADPQPEATE